MQVHGSRAVGQNHGMTTRISRSNPDRLHPTPGYHHITVVESGRTAYLAGQCPLDLSGALVGPGDLDAQIDQVAANALAALSAPGRRTWSAR
jgi:enamine deaminase RidA (YjgF/YER057c/UK114 family)